MIQKFPRVLENLENRRFVKDMGKELLTPQDGKEPFSLTHRY